MTPLSVAVGY